MQTFNFDTPYQMARCLTIGSINAIIDMLNNELKKREKIQLAIKQKDIKEFFELACKEELLTYTLNGESS